MREHTVSFEAGSDIVKHFQKFDLVVFPFVEFVFDENTQAQSLYLDFHDGPNCEGYLPDVYQDILVKADWDAKDDVLVIGEAEKSGGLRGELVFP